MARTEYRDYLNFWYEALATPCGVVIETDNPKEFIQLLYAARAKAADPDLKSFSICTSPTKPETDIWIVRNENATPEGN